MNREELIAWMTSDLGYSTEAAGIAADRLARSHSQVRAALKTWRNTGSTPTLFVEGYTVDRLTTEHGMQPLAALLTLDWLLREPDRAVTSLRKGHDRAAGAPLR